MNGNSPAPAKLHPTVLDAGVVQLARVYAVALFNAATTGNQVDAIIEEYESFVRDVLDRNPNFENMLESGIIGRPDKAATIRGVFQSRASTIFLNYLLVLNDHGRLDLLRPILREMHSISDERAGRVRVQVRAAVPLSANEENALRDRLRQVVTGQPVIHSEVDAALLGGLIIRVGDTVYDGSVRTQLRRLREQLLQRSTHEIQSRRDQFSSTT
jgi:F-type H+-transporting ATPase subunit delta